MKTFAIATAILLMATAGFAQKQRPSPKDSSETKNIKVNYGKPSKNGRDIFPGLEAYGKVWRTGANEATEIRFAVDGKFGGKPVKAGTYTLWTIPGEKEWSVILNSDFGFWGTQHEDHKDHDILTVVVPVKHLDETVEKLNILFEKKDLIIEWDKTQVAVPVDFK